MQFKINDDFGIRTDPYNYIVCEIKKDDEGEVEWKKIKNKPHAKTLEQALNNYIDYRRMTYDDIKSLVELVELNKELRQELRDLSSRLEKAHSISISVEGSEMK